MTLGSCVAVSLRHTVVEVFTQPFNHNSVRWQPVDAIELFFAEPAGSFVLLQRQTTTFNMTPKTMHCQMKSCIIKFNGLHQPFHHDSCFQLFPYFTLQRLFWCLSSFHFPARKLPAILIVAISSLRCEDTPLAIVYNRCYNFYLFHYPTAIFWAITISLYCFAKVKKIPLNRACFSLKFP